MTILDAKKIELVALLSKIGFEPQFHSMDHISWYLSPFRDENTASFKIDTRNNIWHDFGVGIGGDTINFIQEFHKTNTSNALKILASTGFGKLSTHNVPNCSIDKENTSHIKINKVLQLSRPELLKYIEYRCIPLNVAMQYCNEIHYTCHCKNYVAIGFKNDSGGYELRSAYFKGKSCDAISTLVIPGSTSLNIFEGFFDFLSALTYFKVTRPTNTTIILNSTNMTTSGKRDMLALMLQKYTTINLYLDNDSLSNAGQKAVNEIKSLHPNVNDKSKLYLGYKDFNEFIQNKH